MKIFSPILKGTTTVAQGTTNLSGSFTGSLFGTAATASYADNFTVGGTLTAQTINVQIITSSIEFNTGSTRNGALSTNTHQFTGSVLMSTSTQGRIITTNQTATTGYFYSGQKNGTEIAYWYYDDNSIQFSSVSGSRSLNFYTTDTERMRITPAGNVGIGTTTPSEKLEVQNGYLSTYHNVNLDGAGYGLQFYTNGGGSKNTIANILVGQVGTARSGDLIFSTSNNGAPTERMRITSGGNLLVGQTADNPIVSHTAGARIAAESIFSNSSSECMSIQRMNSTGVMAVFYYWSGVGGYVNVGNISTNGSTITFSGTALSDDRYKENIAPITNALESINQVDWVEFKFKENQKNSAGVTAQQLQTIDALSKFVINGSDEESYKAVDYNAIIGYLGKAIQELSAENNTLKEILQRNNIQ